MRINNARIDQLSHAIILCGEEGSGALPLALSFAQRLLCTQPTAEGACGTCAACHKVSHLIHPDLHFAVPVNRPKGTSGSKPPITDEFLDVWRSAYLENPLLTEQDWYDKLDIDNKQGTLSTSEAESILRKLQFKPFEGNSKIMIIWLPERLHIMAANKMLKFLEEPPLGTYFILVTEHPHLVLPTIRSRCMALQVPPPQTKPLSQEDVADVEQLLDHCLTGKPAQAYLWADEMAGMGREPQKAFVLHSLQAIRAYYMLKMGMPRLAYMDPSHLVQAQLRVAAMPTPFFDFAYNRLNAAMAQLERNVNPRPLFCSLALDFFISLRG